VSYIYAEQRRELLTDSGVQTLIKTRDTVQRLLKESGAFRAQEAMQTGDSWTATAALDYLVEQGEIREVPDRYGSGFLQHRIFVKAGRTK
jgi:hypothetical protein